MWISSRLLKDLQYCLKNKSLYFFTRRVHFCVARFTPDQGIVDPACFIPTIAAGGIFIDFNPCFRWSKALR
jgi:hypothetical protein